MESCRILCVLAILVLASFDLQAAVLAGGKLRDDRISVGYDPVSGEVFLDTAGNPMDQMLILSAAGFFSGDPSPLELCDAVFCQDTDFRIERLGFGVGFQDYSFGNVAAKHLSESQILSDWTVEGRYFPTGDLNGEIVDLIYVPESSTASLVLLSLALLTGMARRRIARCIVASHLARSL